MYGARLRMLLTFKVVSSFQPGLVRGHIATIYRLWYVAYVILIIYFVRKTGVYPDDDLI